MNISSLLHALRTNSPAFHLATRLKERGYLLNSKTECDFSRLDKPYAGKKVFLIGNGPSVRHEDLDQLRDHITVCCNRFYLAYSKTFLRPTWLVSSDQQMIDDFGQEIVDCSDGAQVWFFSKKRPRIRGDFGHSSIWSTRDKFRLSLHPLGVVDPGGGTLIAAAQLVIYLGARSLYLYGVDHKFNFQKTTSTDIFKSAVGEGNHFISGYRNNRPWCPPSVLQIETSFSAIDAWLRVNGGFLKNASRESQLPHIERISFESALGSEI